jgi:hypothetical protein
VVSLDALLLCDAATRDATSGKWTLSGVFDVIWAGSFPAVHESLDVYFRLRVQSRASDAATQSLTLRVVYRGPQGALGAAEPVTLTLPHRGMAEGAVRIARLPLPGPGDHAFEVHVDGRCVGETVLTAALLPPPSERLH